MDARGWKVFNDLIQTVPIVTVFINAKYIDTCFYTERKTFSTSIQYIRSQNTALH